MKRVLFILLVVFLIVTSACTSDAEPESTAQATVAQSPTKPPSADTPTPTIVIAPTETAAPTEIATEEPPTTAEVSPGTTLEPAFKNLGALPSSQEIELAIVNQWGGAPQAMALEGTTAYVGFGPRLFVVDVSEPGAPRLLGQSDILPDLVRGIDVVDGLAYLAAGRAGLVVIDASDPAALQAINEGPNYSDELPANASQVIVDDGVAFLIDFNRTDGQSTLLHFDVSDPANVSLVGSHSLAANASIQATRELIVVTSLSELQLRDAAKPGSIMSETRLAGGNYSSRAIIQDDIITVVECCDPSGSKIERFDVSDPYHPAALGPAQELETVMPPVYAAAEGSVMVTASIFGEFGFCQSTVNLVDIAGESAQVFTTFDPQNCLKELVLKGDRLYLTGRSGLQIYDLSDPANPALLGLFRHPDGFHDVQGLARRDGLTYGLHAEGRGSELTTLDLSQQPPDLLLEQQTIGQEPLLDLFTSDDTLIIPVWMGSLYTYDISDPAAPQLLHQPAEGELYSGDLFAAAMKEGVYYTPVVNDALIGAIGAIDLSDPANPVLASTVESGDWQVLNMALNGDTLYTLSQGDKSRISLYDVSQPLAPALIATVAMPEFVSRLAVAGDTVYATCDGHNCQAIYIIDVSDQQNPDITARWTIPFGVRDMASSADGAIYLITSEQRIVSIDGSDPDRLRLTGSQALPGEFIRLKIEGDQIYAAAYDGGLYQLQVMR